MRKAGLQASSVRGDAPVEQGGLTTGGPQHPDEPRRHDTTSVVVPDDRVLVPDAERGHARREDPGVRQRMAALGRRRAVRGEVPVHVDEDGAREVALLVRGAPGSAVQVVAHVGENDPVALGPHPRGIGDRLDHQFLPSTFFRGR